MAERKLLVFGDQTVATIAAIRNLHRQAKVSPLIRRFLNDAADVVQKETIVLNAEERKKFFDFGTIIELAEECAKQEEAEDLIATVLVCVSRVGEMLLYAEKDPSLLGSTDNKIFMIGFCTGLLPAAATAAARDTTELFSLGLEMLAMTVRLAAETTRRSKRVEETPGCWGFLVTALPAEEQQEIINKFNRDERIPSHRSAYISVISQSWTTICGPPTVLTRLFAYSPELGLAPKLRLPIGAAVHASHLAVPNYDEILGYSPLLDRSIPPKAVIMSTSSLKPYQSTDLRSLLKEMMWDITQHTLQLGKTVEAVANLLGKGQVEVTIVGPTSHTSLVTRLLENVGVQPVVQDFAVASTQTSYRGGSNDVAIVGMSGRFPGSESLEDFWTVIQKAQDLHKEIPESRFDISKHYDPTGQKKNAILTKYGCFLDNPGDFDCRLFNISPREAAQMDPMQRLLLMTTYEALEMSGYTRNGTLSTDSRRIATFFGQAADDQREINHVEGIDVYYVPGLARAFAPGRLNHCFKWGGPSYSLDSVCASSCSAVLLACSALNSRDCDTAVAGGGSILNAPHAYAGLSKGGFLSPSGGCKTFRDDADGYCRGEGVGVVILKRLEDAVADNDNIQAVIRGAARNYSSDAASITHPHAGNQESLYRQVLQQACIEPNEVGYVEMHGTATQAGDVVEMSSVTNVFANGRSDATPLYVGAVKANVGHGEAAAGITALIKSLLMFRENSIPPQVGMPTKTNSKFPLLKRLNVRIPDKNVPFKPYATSDGKRKLFLNNFDAAGGNISLLLEDPPIKPQKKADPRNHHVITLSARTPYSLNKGKERLLQWLDKNISKVNIADIAYTTTARRMHDIYRSSYITASTGELSQLLKADVATEPKRSDSKGSVVFAFTGQGAQYAGMGKDLYETCPAFRNSILSSQSECQWLGLPAFVDLITDASVDLTRTQSVQNQLAIVALEIALADLWKSWGIQPSLVIGHSLGEYSALCVAGVLSLSDTLYLVGHRALLLQKKCEAGAYAMLAVRSPAKSVQEILDGEHLGTCEISCFNGPHSTVVSGKFDDIQTLKSKFEGSGLKTTVLRNPYGFHSQQMDSILKDYETIAQGVHFGKPAVPVASTLKGSIIKDAGVFSALYLSEQARGPVDFLGALEACQSGKLVDDQTFWLELGPDPVCLGMVNSTLRVPSSRQLQSLKSGIDNWKTISTSLATVYNNGFTINWTEYHRDYIKCLSLLELPTYSFDAKSFWVPYREPEPQVIHQNAVSAEHTKIPMEGFPTTTLQKVEKETVSADEITVSFISKTAEPELLDVMQGHIVNGMAICPSSVFADMAFTAAKYVHMKNRPGKPIPPLSLNSLDIAHPLVVPGPNPRQIVYVKAVASKKSKWTVNIIFTSTDGSSSHQHGSCHVEFGNKDEWSEEWSKTSYLVKARIDSLIESAKSGKVQRLLRPFVYKLFENVVHYSEKYQGLHEVFLDNDLGDAVASVKLQSIRQCGQFTYAPYWSDPIVHLAGFVLNGNANTPDGFAYLSAGLKSMRILGDLSEDKTYFSYVRMQQSRQKGILTGDVYVFDGESIVALCSGVMFQMMPKKVLHSILGAHAPSVSKEAKATKPAIPAKKERPTKPSTTSFNSILAIIAEEAGLDIDSLADNSKFEDLQIDQLLVISITTKIRDSTGLDIPTSVFSDATVGDVRRYCETEFQLSSADNSDDSDSGESNETPPSSVTSPPGEKADAGDLLNTFLSIVAEETGYAIEDMQEDTLFEDLGVDSLMSVAITDAIKKQTGIDVPAAFFSVHPTVGSVRKELLSQHETSLPEEHLEQSVAEKPAPVATEPPVQKDPIDNESKAAKPLKSETKAKVELAVPRESKAEPTPKKSEDLRVEPAADKAEEPKYSSKVVFLQGRRSSNETPLFLITDGAGSATAYIHLPSFPSGLPIYALESPFLHCPQEYTVNIHEMAEMFVAAIRKTQPTGPYMIGGWSAGAVYAYESSRLLLDAGEKILGLILLDMRVPRPMPDALEPTMELLEQAGLITGIKRAGRSLAPMSQKLKEHLLSTVKQLMIYNPKAMEPSRRPAHTVIIWAKKGMSEVIGDGGALMGGNANAEAEKGKNVMEDESTGLTSWFYAKRHAFGPNGWDKLVGENLECHVVDADHFSMVTLPAVRQTGDIMKKAVSGFVANAAATQNTEN